MSPTGDSIGRWYQNRRESCLELFYQFSDFATASRRHWPAGSMVGLSAAGTVFLRNPDIPKAFSFCVILGSAASAVRYSSQNLRDITQYVAPTTCTLLAITLFIFHGLSSWTTALTWLPVFISVTLLTTVNVAPGVTEVVIALGEGLFALRELGRPVGGAMDQPMDLEQGQDLPGMAELPSLGFRRNRSIDSILGYIRELPVARNLAPPGEETDGSIELDPSSVSTTTEIRVMLQPLESGPDLVPQHANVGHMDGQVTFFPEAPQDQLLDIPVPGSIEAGSRDELPLEMLILA